MREIFDFKSESEEMIVSRILIAIHETINEEFPDASPPPNRFAKTVFSEGESTALNHPDSKVGPSAGALVRRPSAFSSVKNVLFLYFLISLTLMVLVIFLFSMGKAWE